MNKKSNGLKIKSFRGDYVTYYNLPKGKADNKHLRKLLTSKELKQFDKEFEDYFKLISENCVDEALVELLKNFKEEIKSNYYSLLWSEIRFHPMRKAYQAGDENKVEDLFKDKNLKPYLLTGIKFKLFFFADIALAFILGNETMLKDIIKRHNLMSGRKISPIKQKQYEEIIKVHAELLNKYKTGQRCSLAAAIRNYNNTHKLLWDKNKCKSVNQSISQLLKKGKLKYPG